MLDLRLVEKVNTEGSVQSVDRFPATIGKSKNSPPPPPYHMHTRIDNAALSNFHCSIEHSISQNTWTVTDGNPEKTSTNGIWFKPRTATEMERVSSCVMKSNGDRVYLLSTKDNREVFLEVFNPILDPIDPSQTTKSLDPALVRVREEIEIGFKKLCDAGDRRDAKLDKFESALATAESGGEFLIQVSRHWKELIIGTMVMAVIIVTFGSFVFTWLYLDRILPEKTIKNSNIASKNEQNLEEFDRTLRPRI